MLKMIWPLMILIPLMCFSQHAYASNGLETINEICSYESEDDLNINRVFELYGKRKNAVMVNMSGEVLRDYDFSLFRSITIKNDPEAADFVRNCLLKDEKGAKKIKQVVANGIVTSIYLQLPKKHGVNRLVLFNEKFKPKRQLVLIYIESEMDSDDMLKLLLKRNQ